MAIACNEIETTKAYLLQQFQSCEYLGSEDMRLLVDLIDAVDTCYGQGSVTVHNDVTDAGSGAIITVAERAKLASLQQNYLGLYTSLGALQAAHPSPDAGQYAHVDVGAGAEIQTYIWDDNDNKYVLQGGSTSAEDPASIKLKYESNSNTNAFTDQYKGVLDSIDYPTFTLQHKEVMYVNSSGKITLKQLSLSDISDYQDRHLSEANQPIGSRTRNITLSGAGSLNVIHGSTPMINIPNATYVGLRGIRNTKTDQEDSILVGSPLQFVQFNPALVDDGNAGYGTLVMDTDLMIRKSGTWRSLEENLERNDVSIASDTVRKLNAKLNSGFVIEDTAESPGNNVGFAMYTGMPFDPTNPANTDPSTAKFYLNPTLNFGSSQDPLSAISGNQANFNFNFATGGIKTLRMTPTDITYNGTSLLSGASLQNLASTDQSISAAIRNITLSGPTSILNIRDQFDNKVATFTKTAMLAKAIGHVNNNTESITFNAPFKVFNGGVSTTPTITNPEEGTMFWDGPSEELRLYHDGAWLIMNQSSGNLSTDDQNKLNNAHNKVRVSLNGLSNFTTDINNQIVQSGSDIGSKVLNTLSAAESIQIHLGTVMTGKLDQYSFDLHNAGGQLTFTSPNGFLHKDFGVSNAVRLDDIGSVDFVETGVNTGIFQVFPGDGVSFVTIDLTAPTVQSATVENASPDTLIVVFDEAVNITNVTGLSLGGDWTGVNVSSIASGNGTNTISFALSAPLGDGETGTFIYAVNNTVSDTNGNPLAAGSTAITNNVTSNLYTVANAASPVNETNATTGWVYSNPAAGTLTSEAGSATGQPGSYFIRATHAGGAGDFTVRGSMSGLTIGETYQVSFWARSSAGSNNEMLFISNAFSEDGTQIANNIAETWTQYSFSGTAVATSDDIFVVYDASNVNGEYVDIDHIEVIQTS